MLSPKSFIFSNLSEAMYYLVDMSPLNILDPLFSTLFAALTL